MHLYISLYRSINPQFVKVQIECDESSDDECGKGNVGEKNPFVKVQIECDESDDDEEDDSDKPLDEKVQCRLVNNILAVVGLLM